MDGFSFLWKKDEKEKAKVTEIYGGNPPRDEKDAAYQQIIDEDYEDLYSVLFKNRKRR